MVENDTTRKYKRMKCETDAQSDNMRHPVRRMCRSPSYVELIVRALEG